MKVSITCFRLNTGGAERVITSIANKMVQDNNSVDIICLDVIKGFYYPIDERIRIVEIDKNTSRKRNWVERRLANILNFIQLYKAIDGTDVVISFYTKQNCFSIIACKLKRIPIICAERDHFFLNDGFVNRMLRRLFYPLSNGFIHQTKMMRDFLRENYKIKCDDVVLPNPLWIDSFPERNPKTGYISAVGRLAKQKNYVEMIEAFALVHNRIPEARLHIYGEGPEKDKIYRTIERLSLKDAVIIEGLTQDVPSVFSKTEVFVMFSHGEGYPNALMEALACGVPAISSDCPVGGPADMITDGYNGYLVPCGDIELLAERIITLLNSSEQREAFSRNAVAIRETNRFQKIYEQWKDYVEKVVFAYYHRK